MLAHNHLDQEQPENLLKNFREIESPFIRERIIILLLMSNLKICKLSLKNN